MPESSLPWGRRQTNKDSLLHRLEPATKLACAGLLAIALLFVRGWLPLGVLAAFLALSLALASIGLAALARPVRAARYFLLLCVITQALFYTGTAGLQVGPFHLAWQGILEGLLLASRLALLIVISVLLTQTTSFTRLTGAVNGLVRPLGRFARPLEEMLLLLALAGRWVPVLFDEAGAVMAARKSRGVDQVALGPRWAVQMADVAGQVFDRAMARADALAEALECRGYRGEVRRSHWRRTRYSSLDVLAVVATIAATALALWLQFYPLPW